MLGVYVWFCVILTASAGVLRSKELGRIKGKQNLIFSEIDTIKEKIWTDIIPDIDEIKDLIENTFMCNKTLEKDNNRDCQVTASSSKKVTLYSSDDKTELDLSLEKHEQLTLIILRAVEDLKTLTTPNLKTLNNQLIELKDEIRQLRAENRQERTQSNNKVFENSRKLTAITNSFTKLDLSQIDIRETFANITERMDEIESVPTDLRRPSFVSEWILMRSQDAKLSEVIIAHGLGVIPLKVEVQITPTKGPNAGWIFQGASAYQADDDTGKTYGGVVYFYNNSHVLLNAPIKNNNKAAGRIIHTGQSDSRYHGNYHQTENEAFVRIKVWSPNDLPTLSFKSEWKALENTNKDLSYFDIEHGLGDYPALVAVQVFGDAGEYGQLISDGVGSSIEKHDIYSGFGGVIWAVGRTSIRVWTLNSKDDRKWVYFGSPDGWGKNKEKDFNVNIASVQIRVLVWSSKQFIPGQTLQWDHSVVPHLVAINNGINIDNDLVSFFVSANDGANEGYRFYCTGNSQAIGKPYGGAIYAYNAFNNFRVWTPNQSKSGYMVNVRKSFGSGINSQSSNNVTYGAIILKPKHAQ